MSAYLDEFNMFRERHEVCSHAVDIFLIQALLQHDYCYVGMRKGLSIQLSESKTDDNAIEFMFKCFVTGYHVSVIAKNFVYTIGILQPNKDFIIESKSMLSGDAIYSGLMGLLQTNKIRNQEANAGDALICLDLESEIQRRQSSF